MDNERLTLTVNEVARVLGISRGLAYSMVKTGEIPSVRFGKRVLIPRRALEKLLEQGQRPALAPVKELKRKYPGQRLKPGYLH